MATQSARHVSKLLKAIEVLTGLPVVWKNDSGASPGGLPRRFSEHRNPFCMTVKYANGRVRRCSADDVTLLVPRAHRQRRSFFKTCHAGITELVVPLFSLRQYQGVLFLGPFRRNADACRYAKLRALHSAIPPLDRIKVSQARLLLEALATYITSQQEAAELARISRSTRDSRIIEAMKAMASRLHEPISAAEIARVCHLSPSRFIHLFKEETGIPFSRHLTAIRIERAKSLLTHTETRVGDIAAMTGFCNQNYFANIFRQHTGRSPTLYRKASAP